MSKYEVCMEIAGPFALWSRPDTGSTPTSYPVPTWSAAKGILERIAFLKSGRAWIRPTKVQICKKVGEVGGDVKFQQYSNNYRGPLKEKNKGNYQYSSLVLTDVCYRIFASIENGSGKPPKRGDNPSHHLQAMFMRRLEKGQCHATPCLGLSEFVPSYWGLPRDSSNQGQLTTERDEGINLNMVSIVNRVFDHAVAGKYAPSFCSGEDAWIREGEFRYAQ